MQKGTKKLSANSCKSLLFCGSAVFAVPNAENRNETNRLGLHVTMYSSVVRDKVRKTSFISRKSKLARIAIFPGDNTIIRRLYPFFIQEGNKNLAANRLLTTLKNVPMEQTLPLPFFQPSTAVLAKIRQFACTFRPQPYNLKLA